jgi:D-xylulose reductase
MYDFLVLSASRLGLLYSRFQVHFWSHGGIGNKLVDDHPLVMGHEASGEVFDVGSAVTDLKPGDHVAIEGSRPCRQCKRCKEGLYNLCPKMKFTASPPDTDGMLAKYFKIPADFCYKLPKGVSLDEGVLVEPLAVAVHAVRMVNVQPGQSVVVFGSGTIGVLSAAVAKAYGASKVVAVDLLDSKLDFAKRFNSSAIFKPDITVSAEVNAARLISENELGLGADAVIEASGAESSVNTAIHVLRLGGSYVQTGLGKPVVNFPILAMSEKELHCHGAFRYGPGDYETSLGFLERGIFPVKELISNVFPFEKTTEAWETTKRGEGIKNLIQGVQD